MSISNMVKYKDTPTSVVGLLVRLSITVTVKTLVPKRLGLTLSFTVNLLSVVCREVSYAWTWPVVGCCGWLCPATVGWSVPAKTFIRPTQRITATPKRGSQRSIPLKRRVWLARRPSRTFTCWAWLNVTPERAYVYFLYSLRSRGRRYPTWIALVNNSEPTRPIFTINARP